VGWPEFNAALAKEDEVEIVVQVNGRVRAKLVVQAGMSEAGVVEKALADPAVAAHIAGKEVVKKIVVPNKLVNLVVK
jgi:leucyl-tRNA synthetase